MKINIDLLKSFSNRASFRSYFDNSNRRVILMLGNNRSKVNLLETEPNTGYPSMPPDGRHGV